MLDEKLIVRIYTQHNEKGCLVGTGYPITPNLLLTSLHVVSYPEQNKEAGIELVWDSCCKQKNEKLALDAIIYDGDNKYDLALLRCNTSLDKANSPKLATQFPSRQEKYECRGFPLAGQSKDVHDAIPASGTVEGGYATDQLELITKTDIKTEDDWGGLSGAPVFIGKELAGVVNSKYDTVNRLLHATSIPYLLQKSEAFQQAVGFTKQSLVDDIHAKLQRRLVNQIEQILKQKHIPTVALAKQLGIETVNSCLVIAEYMVVEKSAVKVTSSLLTLSLDQEKSLESQKERWYEYLYDVEQLCGWLLLNSVDPEWWFQNEQYLQKMSTEGIHASIPLEISSYIEVIISRNLLQQARYKTDEYGYLVPDNELPEMEVYDASEQATDIQILGDIFKKLRRTTTAPANVDRLLDGIKRIVRSLSTAKNNKPIYYIVTQDYLNLIKSKDWFPKAKKQLSGYFQFICCDVEDNSSEQSPSQDNQEYLLGNIEAIMSLKNKRD